MQRLRAVGELGDGRAVAQGVEADVAAHAAAVAQDAVHRREHKALGRVVIAPDEAGAEGFDFGSGGIIDVFLHQSGGRNLLCVRPPAQGFGVFRRLSGGFDGAHLVELDVLARAERDMVKVRVIRLGQPWR